MPRNRLSSPGTRFPGWWKRRGGGARGRGAGGAGGGVVLGAVRMARGAGAILFGTAGSGEKIDFLRRYGVDHPIDYQRQDFVEEVRKATGGEGVDVILDSIGGGVDGAEL